PGTVVAAVSCGCSGLDARSPNQAQAHSNEAQSGRSRVTKRARTDRPVTFTWNPSHPNATCFSDVWPREGLALADCRGALKARRYARKHLGSLKKVLRGALTSRGKAGAY